MKKSPRRTAAASREHGPGASCKAVGTGFAHKVGSVHYMYCRADGGATSIRVGHRLYRQSRKTIVTIIRRDNVKRRLNESLTTRCRLTWCAI